MRIVGNETEEIILQELGARIKQHRIALNMTQTELADKCSISMSTEVRIEGGVDSKISNYIKILGVLGLLQNLDVLIPEMQPDFKALYEQRAPRQRVRKKEKTKTSWVWGEDK